MYACRYELLGDCVLKLTVCIYLMRVESHRKCEGRMTSILHKMVSNRDLFDAAIVRTPPPFEITAFLAFLA